MRGIVALGSERAGAEGPGRQPRVLGLKTEDLSLRLVESMSGIGFFANHYRLTTRFDLCVAIVSFLSALVFSIKVRNE